MVRTRHEQSIDQRSRPRSCVLLWVLRRLQHRTSLAKLISAKAPPAVSARTLIRQLHRSASDYKLSAPTAVAG
jgi:hypothetical protein